MEILRSFIAVLVILGIAFLASNNKKMVNKRLVIGALGFIFLFGFLTIMSQTGRDVVEWLGRGVTWFIESTNAGIAFLFGDLIKLEGYGFAFALQILPIIIFFSAFMAGLYHLGIMQKVIGGIGGVLQKVLGTNKIESVTASANIFVSISEAPMVVRPYLKSVSTSTLFAISAGGMASVSSSTMISYALLGVPLKYLIPAAFMAAPAGLLIAKIMYPESEKVSDKDIDLNNINKSDNLIEAISNGALEGLKVAASIGALLIAFVSILTLANNFLGIIGGTVGFPQLTFDLIFGYILAPIAFILGVPTSEMFTIGSLIGQKIVLNEFVAFMSLSDLIASGEISEKALIVATFALCGFANIGSISMLIGGMGQMEPSRLKEIVNFGVKALMAGVLANLLVAAVASLFFNFI